MIIYNGATGGLGRYLAPALDRTGEASHRIAARLEDQVGLARELQPLVADGPITFIHLAARVSVAECEADPVAAREVNVTLAAATTATVLRWASANNLATRVIYVSTGHVYAARKGRASMTESDRTAPRSVYGMTKLEAERKLADVAAAHEFPFLAARVFGLIAPRQARNYVLPGLIERVRSRNLAGIPGLDYVRDYLDARDVCEDLLHLAGANWPSNSIVVNVCSGIPISIRQLLNSVIETIGPNDAANLDNLISGGAARPDDVKWLVGDPRRFEELTGAPPRRIPLEVSVKDAVAASLGEAAEA